MCRFIFPLLVLLACPLATAQATNPELKLSVTLRSMRTTYRVTEDIQLEVQLTNTGHRSFLLRRQLGWGYGRTDIRVFDSKGKEVFTTVLADELPPPPVEEDFLKLDPHQFFGVQLQEPIRNFVNAPGTYESEVDYTSHLSEDWAQDHMKLPMPFWSRERGTIESDHVTIVVTP